MSDAVSLFEERSENQKLLNRALVEFKQRGIALAEAEREYRKHLTAKMLQLKQEGFAATTTYDLARGFEEIAEFRYNRDVAETLFKSADHAIQIFNTEKRAIEADLQAQRLGQ